MRSLTLAALLCLCCSIVSAEEYPDFSKIVFETPDDAEKDLLLANMDAMEILTVSEDKYVCRCDGAMAISGTAGNDPIVNAMEFRFVYGEDAENNRQRFIAVETTMFTEGGSARENPEGKLSLVDPGNPVLDVLIASLGRSRETWYSVGGRSPVKLEEQREPLALMKNRVFFNPFNAAACSAAELKSNQLIKPVFKRFNARALNGHSALGEHTIGRWFFNKHQEGVQLVEKEIGLIRWIVFEDKRPVLVEDRYGVPVPSNRGRAQPFARTEIQWSQVGDDAWRPVMVRSKQWGKYHLDIEIEARFSWVLGGAVPEDFFSVDSIGKFTFGESD